MIRRESAVWWLMLTLAALYYVKSQGNPSTWGFDQWIDAGIASATWFIGKMQSSPLKGKAE